VTPPRKPNASSFAALLETAHTLADLSGDVVLRRFRRPTAVQDKGGALGFDPVTAADRDAERAISRYLQRHHPGHSIVGEEHGGRDGDGTSALRWVIDPIDGTKAFIMGSPLWGTLIGLLDGEMPLLGMMNQPFTGERVWSSRTATHWRTADGRTRRAKTRPCTKLEHAILTTTSPNLLGEKDRKKFFDVAARARLTRYGGDCYGYCLLAGGYTDLVIETGLKLHDVVALIPIIERAGGRITTWDGGPATRGGRIVAAGDPALHVKALEILSG
jgi:histidinol phosphatase-like enzyme (inositol monophosphatase family)